MQGVKGSMESWPKASERYRQWLIISGREVVQRDGRVKRHGFPAEEVQAAFREGHDNFGFDGAGAIGDATFIESIKAVYADHFGVQRRHKPKPIQDREEDGVCSLVRKRGG